MSTIQCFMLRDSGERQLRTFDGGSSQEPIWVDDAGNRYALGSERLLDSGELLKGAPPGAMWNATWYAGTDLKPGPDGRHLVVKTPDGDWYIDGKSSNGPGWTRTGDPPSVTANPSILQPNYHGWLRDGKLVEC